MSQYDATLGMRYVHGQTAFFLIALFLTLKYEVARGVMSLFVVTC